MSDPTRLVYDKNWILEHLRRQWSGICVDGVRKYTVLTPEGPKESYGGLDEAYLGSTFRVSDLMAFLRHRLDADTVEKWFFIADPDLVAAHRKMVSLYPNRRGELFAFSPWDRDTVSVISLIGYVRYGEARPLLKRLTRDRSRAVRYSAVMCLGRIASSAPQAVVDLTELLSVPDLRRDAVTALATAGDVAAPALIQALDHPAGLVQNHVVFALPWMEPQAAKPVLLAALRHKDSTIRRWAVSAVIDMQGRGKDVSDGQIVDALAILLRDDNRDTRRHAAIALLNVGPAAARATSALGAAARDNDPGVRRYAARALQAIKDEPAKPR